MTIGRSNLCTHYLLLPGSGYVFFEVCKNFHPKFKVSKFLVTNDYDDICSYIYHNQDNKQWTANVISEEIRCTEKS